MSQVRGVGPIDEALGYVLKRATTALRSEMDTALRPLGLTVPQYSCLEVLDQRSPLSGSELARATFVTRQSMNLLLAGLQQRGLLSRASAAEHGKALPIQLTEAGREHLRAASIAVQSVQERMFAPLAPHARRRLLADLTACTAALASTTETRRHGEARE